VLKNLNKLERIPEELREKIFKKLFKTAEIAKFNPEQVISYEDSLKYYRDIKNSLDTAWEEGKVEGKIEEKIEIAINLLKNGVDIQIIEKSTGLSKAEIENLKKKVF
jgi:predicted transposase/invertase (TIGR01784 family)